MDNVENKYIDVNLGKHPIMKHQNFDHSSHSMSKSSNLSVSNRSVSITSAQKTLRQYFMNNNSKTIAPIDNMDNVSPSLVGGTPADKEYKT